MSGQGQQSAASFPEAADAFGSGGGDKTLQQPQQQQQQQQQPQSAGGLNDLLGLGRNSMLKLLRQSIYVYD